MAKRDEGQALVEAALTLPLVVFCILGALQLFLLLHARIVAEYAVYRAVRAGSLNHGDCDAMKHAAVVSLLPAIERTDTPERVGEAFRLHKDNRYDPGENAGHDGQIVEIWREQPKAWVVPTPEDIAFDQPNHRLDPDPEQSVVRLEARMVFWVRLKIPFADWVLTRMFLAYWGVKPYERVNPLIGTQTASWQQLSQAPRWPGGDLGRQMRAWSEQGHYLFPVQTNFGMRMMTPARKKFFAGQGCPL